jgi:hypothetical protein
VRSDPPLVFLATDAEVLSRLVALLVVARTEPRELDPESLGLIRDALLEERWGDAVLGWIEAMAEPVDAYPDEEVWTDGRLDAEAAALEIRMSRIFDEPDQ